MNEPGQFQFDDLQALLRFGLGHLTESSFLLLNIKDAEAAKAWLKSVPVTHAASSDAKSEKALQIAFSAQGLYALGISETVLNGFSDEFIIGMGGDSSRSRRLGDIENNAPEKWLWGGKTDRVPHVLLLLYARPGCMDTLKNEVENTLYKQAFKDIRVLPTRYLDGDREPFGFKDGISQPSIDWRQEQSTDPHDREQYSNLVAPGEFVLGYPNEYGQYSARPLIDASQDAQAAILPNAEDNPELRDFGCNGSYLVLRQLSQDVPGFWQFMDKAAGTGSDQEKKEKRLQLASAMVGRHPDGKPLVPTMVAPVPGNKPGNSLNNFTYDFDSKGHQCPIGAHIRRSNPRTGDLPGRSNGYLDRLKKTLGFAIDPEEDLIASTRFHRLLRRGRTYGELLTPEQAVNLDKADKESGLQFICLVGNIHRQFEFVQNAWSMNSKFGGLQNERDPVLGHRQSLSGGESTDGFSQPDKAGPGKITGGLPQFVKVLGGGYFFMPGLKAIEYIASVPARGDE